jgi:hypothetical protein
MLAVPAQVQLPRGRAARRAVAGLRGRMNAPMNLPSTSFAIASTSMPLPARNSRASSTCRCGSARCWIARSRQGSHRSDAHARPAADGWRFRPCGLASLLLRMGRLARPASAGRAGADAAAAEPHPAAAIQPGAAAHGGLHRLACGFFWAFVRAAARDQCRSPWAHSLDRDSGWVAAKRGGYADTWRERHDRGCDIIARGLRACRTPVFYGAYSWIEL